MARALSGRYREGALFHAYHALESVACAAIVSAGFVPPRAHHKKVEAFHRRFGTRFPQFAFVTASLEPLRNQALYPVLVGGTWAPPQQAVSSAAPNLVPRASGLVTAIIQGLSL
jgi:hypothetical protein